MNRIPTVEHERPYRERAEEVAHVLVHQGDELDRMKESRDKMQDEARYWETQYSTQLELNTSLQKQVDELLIYKEIIGTLESELSNVGLLVVNIVRRTRGRIAELRNKLTTPAPASRLMSGNITDELADELTPRPVFLDSQPQAPMTASQRFLQTISQDLNRG